MTGKTYNSPYQASSARSTQPCVRVAGGSSSVRWSSKRPSTTSGGASDTRVIHHRLPKLQSRIGL